jgi:predicted flap endonuclease-1-like 5' DNA nuclease
VWLSWFNNQQHLTKLTIMFELNPLMKADAWWQHLLMLLVAAIIGYIIGYITKQGEIGELESQLALLDADLDDCQKNKKVIVPATPAYVAPVVAAVAAPIVETFVAPIIPVVPNDLKIVEGIGPKIEELLNNEGILTFAQLADTAAERVKEILVAAGSRFQMHDPTTWPAQSKMAAEGRFDELKVWQDELNKGKE